MKKPFLLLFLLATCLVGSGQEKTENKNWSVGVNLFSLGYDYRYLPVYRLGNGVMVKKNYKPFAIRIGAEYIFEAYDKDEFWAFDVPAIGGNSNELLLKFGLEKSVVNIGFFSLYGALDLFGNRHFSDLDVIGGWGSYNENRVRTTYSIGFMPVVGMQFKINERLTINTEIRIHFSKNYSKIRTKEFDANMTSEKNEVTFNRHIDKGFSSLSLNYRF